MAFLGCLKADLRVKEGKMKPGAPHGDSLCMVAPDCYKPLPLHQGTDCLLKSPPWFYAFLKGCLLHNPIQELFYLNSLF